MNEDLLKESLDQLYEEAPCGYIFTLPDGTIARVNQTFLDLTGYDRDELVSKKRLQDLLTVPGKIFYENQYAPLLRMQGFVREVTFDLICSDGNRLPVLVNSVQRTDENGNPLLIASTIFDATDRRRYEHELLLARRRAEQLAAVVTASSDAILSASSSGVVETWNAGAERLFRYAAQEIVGRSLRDLVPRWLDEAEWNRIMGRLQAGQPIHLETEGRDAGGGRIDVSIGLTPHLGPIGDLAAISSIIRDISERKKLERLQQEFLAMASHELRNPVAAIKGHAQLMRRRGSYSEQMIDTINTQVNQLGRLIDDLLLASQIEADRFDLRLEEVDLVTQARVSTESMRTHRSAIRFDAPADPITIRADRHRLNQVITNLLTNAIKYSPQESEIMVRVTSTVNEAKVEVVDQGVGIPPEAIQNLFKRFYRVEATTRRAQGLGLGLYITQRIVESHGGRIDVASRPGEGSTFTVTLPRPAKP